MIVTKIVTNKPPRVFFDASVSEFKVVGIGIYEMVSGEKTSITIQTNKILGSCEAEEIAFKRALEFAINTFESKIIYLFTDNRQVYLDNRHLIEQYKKNGYSFALNWVPRELNVEADKLSKLASSRGSVTGCNKVEKYIEKELLGTPITVGLSTFIRCKPISKRVQMAYNLFKSDLEVQALNFYIKGIGTAVPPKKQNELRELALFLSTVIISSQERKQYPKLIPFLTTFRAKGSPKNSCPVIKDRELETIIRKKTTTRSK